MACNIRNVCKVVMRKLVITKMIRNCLFFLTACLCLSATTLKNFDFITIDQHLSVSATRKKRLRRLKSFEWQVKNAFCFYAIIQDCYSGLKFKRVRPLCGRNSTLPCA